MNWFDRQPYAYQPYFRPPCPSIDPAALLSNAERKFLIKTFITDAPWSCDRNWFSSCFWGLRVFLFLEGTCDGKAGLSRLFLVPPSSSILNPGIRIFLEDLRKARRNGSGFPEASAEPNRVRMSDRQAPHENPKQGGANMDPRQLQADDIIDSGGSSNPVGSG